MDIIVTRIDLCLKHSHVNRTVAMAMTDSKDDSIVVGRNSLTATSRNSLPRMMLTAIHICFLMLLSHQSSKNHVIAEYATTCAQAHSTVE